MYLSPVIFISSIITVSTPPILSIENIYLITPLYTTMFHFVIDGGDIISYLLWRDLRMRYQIQGLIAASQC